MPGRMDCADFYMPTVGSTEFGMTQIQAFDLDLPTEPPRAVAIVGAAETVYGNASSLVLAGRAYTDPWLIRQSYGYGADVVDANWHEPAAHSGRDAELHASASVRRRERCHSSQSTWLPARYRAT